MWGCGCSSPHNIPQEGAGPPQIFGPSRACHRGMCSPCQHTQWWSVCSRQVLLREPTVPNLAWCTAQLGKGAANSREAWSGSVCHHYTPSHASLSSGGLSWPLEGPVGPAAATGGSDGPRQTFPQPQQAPSGLLEASMGLLLLHDVTHAPCA